MYDKTYVSKPLRSAALTKHLKKHGFVKSEWCDQSWHHKTDDERRVVIDEGNVVVDITEDAVFDATAQTVPDIMAEIDRQMGSYNEGLTLYKAVLDEIQLWCHQQGVRGKFRANKIDLINMEFFLSGKNFENEEALFVMRFMSKEKYIFEQDGEEHKVTSVSEVTEYLNGKDFLHWPTGIISVEKDSIYTRGCAEDFRPYFYRYGLHSITQHEDVVEISSGNKHLDRLVSTEQKTYQFTQIRFRTPIKLEEIEAIRTISRELQAQARARKREERMRESDLNDKGVL